MDNKEITNYASPKCSTINILKQFLWQNQLRMTKDSR